MNNIKYIVPLLFIITFFSCNNDIPVPALKQGMWRGEITAQNNKIPFNFEIFKRHDSIKINLINGDEILPINKVNLIGDTLTFKLHIFDSEIRAKIDSTHLTGFYKKNYASDYKLPFTAVFNKHGRFDHVNSSDAFDGTWETVFKNNKGKKTKAIGIFKNDQNTLRGTFLTSTGDYRYLDGYTVRDTMFLYSFDGNHIFKFKAFKKNDSVLKGKFWSGKTGFKTFISKRNDTAKLPDANDLTFLKDGYDKIDFTLKGLDGKPVSLNDKKYQGKVVILQIFGTWCPNCMDETRFFADWYRRNKHRGVEIIGLAYENKDDFDYAKSRVENMIKQLHVDYDFLIAGTSSNKSVSESLPALNKFMSFPTTIIIDKKGKVRQIHTGFSGPATGKYYEQYKEEFNLLINELISE